MKITGKIFELDHQYNKILLEITESQMQKLSTFLHTNLLPEFRGQTPLLEQYNLVKIQKANLSVFKTIDDLESPLTIEIIPKPYNFVTNKEMDDPILIRGISFHFKQVVQI